ncbi:MAG: putative Glyoxalase [Microbacteriaceae bacterium]|nr:putative Glyoxalase [Microbacteriaceae bacterium]
MNKPTLNHFGLTVRDIHRSIDFYSRLGGTLAVEVAQFSGPDMDEGLRLEGVDLKACMISIGGTLIELLQYDSPRGSDYESGNQDVGSAHIALQVDDIHELHRSLSDDGYDFYSAPKRIGDGPFEGGYFVYFRDPDGITVELIQPGPGFAAAIAAL